jgi:ribosomal-protein-alanine N-acetyltransferase
MTEGMPIILDYAFHKVQLHRIEGFVESKNIACKRGIEKLGFQWEGCMRDCEVKDEAFISLDIYALLH